MAVRVGSARSNENGGVTGGQAGDQKNGAEVSTQSWYLHSKGWVVVRAKDDSVREKIAKNMEAGCANDNIGYCQTHRTAATEASKPYGYDLSKVTEAVEVDCSELVRICCLYAGIQVGTFSTATEKMALKNTGKFDILEDDKSCKSSDYLFRGDILVTKTKGHTVVVLDNGSKAGQKSSSSASSSSSTSQSSRKIEAAKSRDDSISGTYYTTANLNLRAGAGTGKTSLVIMPKGTAVKCYGYYTLYQGKRWYYVKTTVKGTSYTGFCSSAYLTK